MHNPQPVDFGELTKREFSRQTFQRLWALAVPDAGERESSVPIEAGAPLQDLTSLGRVLDIRDDGAWLSSKWLLLSHSNATKLEKTHDVLPLRIVPMTEAEAAGLAAEVVPAEPDGLLWSARQELAPADGDLVQHPMLQFPFSACDLAAFMLGGAGYFLAEAFGGLHSRSPELGFIGDVKRYQCGDALVGAWRAFKLAEKVAGPRPLTAQQLTATLPKGEPNLPLGKLRAADRNHAKKFKTWRRRMTELLWIVDAEGPEPAAQPGLSLKVAGDVSASGQAPAFQGVRVRRWARRDVLWPVIEMAQNAAADRFDSAAVWGELERLARLPNKDRPAPLLSVNSGGVSWLDGGQVEVLTRRALGNRLRRARQAESLARPR